MAGQLGELGEMVERRSAKCLGDCVPRLGLQLEILGLGFCLTRSWPRARTLGFNVHERLSVSPCVVNCAVTCN